MAAQPVQHARPATSNGTFGRFGGRMMPEALMAALDELTAAWQDAMADPAFTGEFERMLREYAGTPSLLYEATKLSERAGARILLKRALGRKNQFSNMIGTPRSRSLI